jgi:hypothetical protein
MMTKVRTLAVMGWLFSTTAAYAGSPGWTVSEASGSVAISRAGLSNAVFNRTAAKGGKVTEGDIIATGANGRAVIVRGEEYVIVAPNSRLRIVNTTETNTLTQFFQSAGNSVFKIKKKMTPHFGVQTPYLAAVVKGTTFSVTVTPTGAAVQVTEGRVQVSTLDGAATHLVIPGEIGMVSQGMPYRLTVQGAEPQIIDSPNRGQLLQKPQPSADTTDSKPAESDSAASVVADADTPKDAPVLRPSQKAQSIWIASLVAWYLAIQRWYRLLPPPLQWPRSNLKRRVLFCKRIRRLLSILILRPPRWSQNQVSCRYRRPPHPMLWLRR